MASEIRVDKINSLSGVGTVTLSPTGVDIAGITTAATLRATTGIVTSLTAGSLTSLGAVSGTTGTFSGAVSGTTGTFSGAVSGTTGTFTSHVSLGDSDQLRFGDSNDLVIQHNGTDSLITDTGTGDLYIRGSDDIFIQNAGGDKTFATFNDGGTVQLYHNGVEKFSTQSYGIIVDGVVSFTKDANDDTTSTVQVNGAAMTSDDYLYIMSAANNSVNGLTIFLNGSTRGSDGGNNGLTIRNDNGPMSVGSNNATHSNYFYTGAAGGIDFSGDGNTGNMTSELLDDYEEGDYLPSFTVGSGSVTLDSSRKTLSYTKIGRKVTIIGQLKVASVSGPSGIFRASLPFTRSDQTEEADRTMGNIVVTNAAVNNANEFSSYPDGGGDSYLEIVSISGTSVNRNGGNNMQSNTYIYVNYTYFAS